MDEDHDEPDEPMDEQNQENGEDDAVMYEQDTEIDHQPVQHTTRKRNHLNDQQRYAAYVAMHALCMRNGGRFKRRDKQDVADFFNANIQIIQRVWRLVMK